MSTASTVSNILQTEQPTTKQLLKLRRDLNKDIYKMHKAISINKNKITNIESQLWLTCDHQWIYDEWASSYDRVKHLCKICKCYRDPRLYTPA